MKFAKVMFLHPSVSHSVHMGAGGSASVHAGIHPQEHPPGSRHSPGADTPLPEQSPPEQTPPKQTPPEQTPPAQCILGDTGNKRAVCILLECILVVMYVLPANKVMF